MRDGTGVWLRVGFGVVVRVCSHFRRRCCRFTFIANTYVDLHRQECIYVGVAFKYCFHVYIHAMRADLLPKRKESAAKSTTTVIVIALRTRTALIFVCLPQNAKRKNAKKTKKRRGQRSA